MTTYVDVILPLYLRQAYSYIVPDTMLNDIAVGKRVLVSFGRNKYYSGIIQRIHQNTPEYAKIKSIEEVIDSEPLVTENQIALWEWMASYYMESIGNFMDLALPAAYKLTSERIYILNPHFSDVNPELSDEEWTIYDAIRTNGKIGHKELHRFIEIKNKYHTLNHLIQKGLVIPTEEVNEKSFEKYEKFISISVELKQDFNRLNHTITELMTKSKKQYQILMTYFSMSKGSEQVVKSDLLIAAKATSASIKPLLDKSILIETKSVVDRLDISTPAIEQPIVLSPAQAEILVKINEIHREKNIVLLHGITGSGKTEIYMKWLQSIFESGGTAVMILPEIALTAQIIGRLKATFGNSMVVYHSQVSQRAKYEIWKKIKSGSIRFVIGTRSALFLPYSRLDAIVIDEEHDQSLRQIDRSPRYNSRDSFVWLSQKMNSKVILGSATPSAESYFNTQIGKIGFVQLSQRYGNAKLPSIEIVDISSAERKKQMKSHFSDIMCQDIESKLEKGEQMMIFHNRRGFSPYIQCESCEYIHSCTQCDVRLTYHKTYNMLLCHYCGFKHKLKPTCPSCTSTSLKTRGLGTQKIEEELQLFYPKARIARLDTDVARSGKKMEAIINGFKNGEIDILVGTQMISKGFDFENLNWVGIINADALLHFTEYNTHEKAFQTLVQICGRSGRRDTLGKVLIQTYTYQDPTLQFVIRQDWMGFITRELELRKEFIYPPFCKMIKIIIKHKNLNLLEVYSDSLAQKLKSKIEGIVLGPNIPPIARIQNLYIKEIYIKLPRNNKLSHQKINIQNIIDHELLLISNKNFRIDIIVDY